MNDKNHSVHSLFSLLYLIQGNHEEAIEEGKKAITLGPSVAGAYMLFGEVLIYSGYFEEAVKMCEAAMRLHPYAPLFYLGHTLTAYYWVDRYDESLILAEQHIDKSRKAGFTLGVVWGLMGSIMVKIKLGRLSEARQDADEILKIWPWYNLDYVRSIIFYKDPAHLEHWIDGLRTAGIPEHIPSQ